MVSFLTNEVISLKRCVIITSFQSSTLKDSFDFREDDYIICADNGYFHARLEGIKPNAIIGDFDSMDSDLEDLNSIKDCEIIRLAVEKDDTDTLICLKYGIEQGFDDFFILGGLGGRLDHTIANLQTMSHAIDHGKSIWFLDGKNRATLRNPGKLLIQKLNGFKISLFTFTDFCEGVFISGVKYPLENCLLKNNFPLGVSNEFLEEQSQISHSFGKLLIILSKD